MKKVSSSWQLWFQRKGRLQILAALLSLLAWFLVQSSQPVKEFRIVRLAYTNDPGLSFAKEPIDGIRVTLTGSVYRIRSLDVDDLVYEVDLSSFSAGRHTIDFDVANLKLPFEVEISQPFPRRFEVTLEKAVTRELPVEAIIENPPPDLFAVRAIEFDPNPVQVRGAGSVVQNLEKFEVPLDLSERRESFETAIRLEKPHPLVESVRLLSVRVDIQALDIEKVFEDVAVVSVPEVGGVEFTPSTARVVLRGSREDFAQEDLEIKVQVPVQGLSRGQGQRVEGRLFINNPNIKEVSLEPRQFIVDFKR